MEIIDAIRKDEAESHLSPSSTVPLSHTHPHAPYTLIHTQTHNLSPPGMLPCAFIGGMSSPSCDPLHHNSAGASEAKRFSWLGIARASKNKLGLSIL